MTFKSKLLQGDCLEVMRQATPNSVDTIITDPPYGLSFMGKKWDYDVPSIEVWKECLRVLKPGGTALIFAGSRTQHRMAVAVEDAGFILKDCIMWLYASGFPKATDISKQLDKGHERKVVGYKEPFGREGRKTKGKAKFESEGWETDTKVALEEPATPEAKLWNGWKSHGLKPAYEPILVAMKPNDGTYAENALKYGVAGLNIDGGRIGVDDSEKESFAKEWDREQSKSAEKGGVAMNKGLMAKDLNSFRPTGRFPANCLLSCNCEDDKNHNPDCPVKMLDVQSGVSKSNVRVSEDKDIKKSTWSLGRSGTTPRGVNDKGGASRFFYIAKASKRERNMGCEGLEEKQTTGGGGINNTPDDVCGKYGSIKAPGKNHHPTVKPLKLMEYLCTLTKTPTGGVVLDPFMGSGTTGIACRNTGRDFIGIEKEPEYFEIAKRRINAGEQL